MTVTVLDSSDLVEAVTTGKIPVPAGVAEDNAAQAAKREAARKPSGETKPSSAETTTPAVDTKTVVNETKTTNSETDPDDVEGEDGVTPRQKREFTESVRRTIAKKHRLQREAEEFATAEYNRGRLAEERAERLERENAALKRQMAPPASEAAEESAPPDRAKFETDAAYQDALIDYRVDQKLKAQAAEDQKRRETEALEQLRVQAGARIDAARELVPDYDEVTGGVDMPVAPHIAGYMQESELFAELGYHFAKNPDVLAKLNAMTDGLKPGTPQFVRGITRSLVEVGKIVGKLQPFAPPAKVDGTSNGEEPSRTNGSTPSTETGSIPSKPRSAAPTIRPLNAGSASQVTKDEAEMKPAEVINAWQKKHGVNLTARKRH